jgi:hypothetical protein
MADTPTPNDAHELKNTIAEALHRCPSEKRRAKAWEALEALYSLAAPVQNSRLANMEEQVRAARAEVAALQLLLHQSTVSSHTSILPPVNAPPTLLRTWAHAPAGLEQESARVDHLVDTINDAVGELAAMAGAPKTPVAGSGERD